MKQEGFTVLEVLVALVLFAILSAMFLLSVQSNTSATLSASSLGRANQITNNLNSRVSQHDINLDSGESSIYIFTSDNLATEITPQNNVTNCSDYLAANQTLKNFCATVSNNSTFNPTDSGASVLGSSMELYTTRVCWYQRGVKCAESKSIY